MKAELRVVVEGDRVVDLAVDPPLGAKVIDGPDGPVLYLVNTAASLLEGDDLFIDLRIRSQGRLNVRSVAAQVAHPCLSEGSTGLTVRVDVGVESALSWRPEPLILCAQSNHRSLVEVELSEDATLEWVDELVLGRSGEDAATVSFAGELFVARSGSPLLEDGLALTPATSDVWRGPAILGHARFVGSRLRVGGSGAIASGWTALAGGGRLARVVDVDPLAGRRRLALLA